MKISTFILATLFLPLAGICQYYQALNGTYYTGSLAIHNNPAAIAGAPLKWDLAVFGIQDKHSSNVIDVSNYSLLSNPAGSEYAITPGEYKRKADINVNLNLLNFRLSLNRSNAVALGINFKSYTRIRSSRYNFYDTLQRFGDFFLQNENNQEEMSMDMVSGSWTEFYAAYGRTILDNDRYRLNGGAVFKINRGLSGGFARLSSGSFSKTGNFPESYLINTADIEYSYSANYDQLDNGKDFRFSDFYRQGKMGFSIDMGLELLIKRPYTSNRQQEEQFFDYDWKIGLSLIDAGYSSYSHGRDNIRAFALRPGITDQTLDQKFDTTITSLSSFRDSLATLFQHTARFSGDFKIIHPARIVLNADKFISEAFFINADLSIGIASLTPFKSRYLEDLSFLTITPRWETLKKGFYLPIQYNSVGQLWIGGAVRLGPLLFGLHNFGNLFSKKKMHKGTGYLAVILKASDLTSAKADKRLDCW